MTYNSHISTWVATIFLFTQVESLPSSAGNCTASGFVPSDVNGVYLADSDKVWKKMPDAFFMYIHPSTTCWVISSTFTRVADKSKKNSGSQQFSWLTQSCHPDKGLEYPPVDGWMNTSSTITIAQPYSAILQSGVVTCFTSTSPSKIDLGNVYASRMDGNTQSELIILLVFILGVWGILVACKVFHARRRMGRSNTPRRPRGLVEITIFANDHADTYGRMTISDPVNAGKPPQQIALEAVAVMQGALHGGTMVVTCPTDTRDGSGQLETKIKLIRWSHTCNDGPAHVQTSQELCCMCLETAPDVRLLPCGHKCACRLCLMHQLAQWKQAADPFCPICRTPLESICLDKVPVASGSDEAQVSGTGVGVQERPQRLHFIADMVFASDARAETRTRRHVRNHANSTTSVRDQGPQHLLEAHADVHHPESIIQGLQLCPDIADEVADIQVDAFPDDRGAELQSYPHLYAQASLGESNIEQSQFVSSHL